MSFFVAGPVEVSVEEFAGAGVAVDFGAEEEEEDLGRMARSSGARNALPPRNRMKPVKRTVV